MERWARGRMARALAGKAVRREHQAAARRTVAGIELGRARVPDPRPGPPERRGRLRPTVVHGTSRLVRRPVARIAVALVGWRAVDADSRDLARVPSPEQRGPRRSGALSSNC